MQSTHKLIKRRLLLFTQLQDIGENVVLHERVMDTDRSTSDLNAV
jgi:hypothetical protein